MSVSLSVSICVSVSVSLSVCQSVSVLVCLCHYAQIPWLCCLSCSLPSVYSSSSNNVIQITNNIFLLTSFHGTFVAGCSKRKILHVLPPFPLQIYTCMFLPPFPLQIYTCTFFPHSPYRFIYARFYPHSPYKFIHAHFYPHSPTSTSTLVLSSPWDCAQAVHDKRCIKWVCARGDYLHCFLGLEAGTRSQADMA